MARVHPRSWMILLVLVLVSGLFPALPSDGVYAQSSAPVLEQLPPQTLPRDMSVWIDFVVSDPDTPLRQLSFQARSHAPQFIPSEGLALKISEERQSILVKPVRDHIGTTKITIEVSDGIHTSWMSFEVTVPSVPKHVLTTGPWEFPSGDRMQGVFARFPDASPASLEYTATSSEPHLIATLTIDEAGQFVLSLTTQNDWYGTANVDLFITDGRQSIEYTLPVRVYRPNLSPTVGPIPDQTMDENTTLSVPITLFDPDTPVEELEVYVGTRNVVYIPATGFETVHSSVIGTGEQRTVLLTPPKDRFGSIHIVVIVSDGYTSTERRFKLTVEPTGPPFTVSEIPDAVIPEDYTRPTKFHGRNSVRAFLVSFMVIQRHGGPITFGQLSLSNPELFSGRGLSNNGYPSGGIEQQWSVHLLTHPNRVGTSQATVVLTNDTLSVTRTFTITIEPINDPPTFQAGPDQTVQQKAGSQVVPDWAKAISAGPYEEEQVVEFHLTTDRPDLFATAPALSPDGTLTYTPTADKTGTAKITVTLKDNGGIERGGQNTSLPSTFTITVTGGEAPSPAVQDNPVAPNPNPKGSPLFTDLPPTHWAHETVQHLAEQQIVTAIAADQFAPDAAITRETLAAWLVRAFHLEEDAMLTRQFSDVAEENPLTGVIGGVVKAGLMLGDAGGTFRPEAPVSRQELALVLLRVLQQHAEAVEGSENGAATFAALQDQHSIAPWALEGVRFVVERDLMTGRPGPTFAPGEKTTRAEAATVIGRMLELAQGE